MLAALESSCALTACHCNTLRRKCLPAATVTRPCLPATDLPSPAVLGLDGTVQQLRRLHRRSPKRPSPSPARHWAPLAAMKLTPDPTGEAAARDRRPDPPPLAVLDIFPSSVSRFFVFFFRFFVFRGWREGAAPHLTRCEPGRRRGSAQPGSFAVGILGWWSVRRGRCGRRAVCPGRCAGVDRLRWPRHPRALGDRIAPFPSCHPISTHTNPIISEAVCIVLQIDNGKTSVAAVVVQGRPVDCVRTTLSIARPSGAPAPLGLPEINAIRS